VESGGGGGGAGTAGGGRRVELGLGHGGLELAAASWAASGGNENKIKQATMMHWAKNEERWNGLQDYLSNFIQGFWFKSKGFKHFQTELELDSK
jgi:hypothetical protein